MATEAEGAGSAVADGGEPAATTSAEAEAPKKPASLPKITPKHVRLDLTGLRNPDGPSDSNLGDNSRLSDKVKTEIHELHTGSPSEWTTLKLAQKYRVREQRIMAIIALKTLELQKAAKGEVNKDAELEMERHFGTVESGTGEKHVAFKGLIQSPKFVVAARGSDGSEYVVKRVDGGEVTAESLARDEELALVKDFKERLDFNVGAVGKTLQRGSRMAVTPKRPEGGWGIVFTPIGESKSEPFVSLPSGQRRSPTEDEKLLLDRAKPKPRAKII
jgi:hypothetical protein